MKIIFLILLIVFANARDLSTQIDRKLNGDAMIHQLFEMLKYYIKNGDEVKHLPVSDPLRVDCADVEFAPPSKLISLQAGFSEVVVAGLGGYQLRAATFREHEVAVNLTIQFPSIMIKSDYYKMAGDIYGAVPVAGEGKFELEIKNFIFKGKVFLKQSGDEKSVLINRILHPEFSIQQITSDTEFDGTIDDILNTLIEELLARYLTRFNKYLTRRYLWGVISHLNTFLNKFESWRLLAAVL